MSRYDELWYTTGSSSGRLPADSPMARALRPPGTETPEMRVADALREIGRHFGAINDTAATAAMNFEDAKVALSLLSEMFGDDIMKEPDHCAFCKEVGARRKHHLSTRYLPVPIWTRVCPAHADEPLCTSTPTGAHEHVVTADHPDFELKYTVVVDPERLSSIGHCRRCAVPLILDQGRWRYWTPMERGHLLVRGTSGTRAGTGGGR